jgi:putative transcriptional regulator
MDKAFSSIMQGLTEAIEHAEGKENRAKVHRPQEIDVSSIRFKLGLTQVEFASKFCISLGTLRHWERGDRKPNGPALALLHVVDKEPEAVLRALA